MLCKNEMKDSCNIRLKHNQMHSKVAMSKMGTLKLGGSYNIGL